MFLGRADIVLVEPGLGDIGSTGIVDPLALIVKRIDRLGVAVPVGIQDIGCALRRQSGSVVCDDYLVPPISRICGGRKKNGTQLISNCILVKTLLHDIALSRCNKRTSNNERAVTRKMNLPRKAAAFRPPVRWSWI